MDKLIVSGPHKLSGSVKVSSAKNATLPILAATLLFDSPVLLADIPKLNDVQTMLKLMESLGLKITRDQKNLTIDASDVSNLVADYALVKTMRASVLVLGPMLSRYGKAKVSLPGGCAIGARPVDIHLTGLEKMGASIQIDKGYIIAECKRLKGGEVTLSFPSVGATENIMMAAVYAEGETIIENAAREPEIVDLANFLIHMGVPVEGAGTSRIKIIGTTPQKKYASNKPYRPIGDRIEAATFIIAALMAKSSIKVLGFEPWTLDSVLETLEKMGAKFKRLPDGVEVLESGRLKGAVIETAPFPGFPTDVQAQMMSLMCLCEGNSVITEQIFENRYMHVPELIRMGCQITLKGNAAMVEGVESLSAAPVMCTDLRASAALVLAALQAQGESEIQRVYHLDRGYEDLEGKFKGLGAKIERVK
ncbi:MAG: UDP-N-acetylglucosamine 1-carboxyvinyltransferase [Bacteriovoracaceae bacterium]|nr:UDP-N-acetylglucosamine 1-carboxyvinyltransferase [Bacteriovoracaceae bacterium]